MGRVFTWTEIEADRLPRRVDFEDVRDVVRGAFASEARLDAGLIYGSVLAGTTNVRSDFDLLVVFDGAHTALVIETLQGLVHTACARGVPMNIIAYTRATAKTSGHRNGPMFRAHLEYAARGGGVIGNNPLDWLEPPRITQATESLAYAARRHEVLLGRMCQRAGMDEHTLARLRTKMLEAPLRTTRRALEAVLGQDYSGMRGEICALAGSALDPQIARDLRTHLARDASYTAFLEDERGKRAPRRHRDWLEKNVDTRLPEILNFLERLIALTHAKLVPRT